MEPTFKFHVNVSKITSNDKILWKATINKKSFPNINVTESPKLYHLDEQKYRTSFKSIFDLFGSLPTSLFDYEVSLNGDEIMITGVTETTVRVAIVDLITQLIPNVSVKMVRPPLDFRVYTDLKQLESNEIDTNISGIFGITGDY